jgi:hypothetical protein
MKGKNSHYTLVFVVFLFFSYSCKSLQLKTRADKDISMEDIKENYQPNLGDFHSFSASRMSISLLENGMETSIRGNMRLVRDSAILVSLNAGLGLEIVRAFLTPSNMQIINRINSEYSNMKYSDLNNLIGISADFKMVEKLLLNSFSLSELVNFIDYDVSPDNETVIIYDRRNSLINGFDEAKVYFRKNDLLVWKIELFNNQKQYYALIEYSDFSSFDKGVIIPLQVKVFVNREGETMELIVRYLKADINTVKGLTFVVPSRYL